MEADATSDVDISFSGIIGILSTLAAPVRLVGRFSSFFRVPMLSPFELSALLYRMHCTGEARGQ